MQDTNNERDLALLDVNVIQTLVASSTHPPATASGHCRRGQGRDTQRGSEVRSQLLSGMAAFRMAESAAHTPVLRYLRCTVQSSARASWPSIGQLVHLSGRTTVVEPANRYTIPVRAARGGRHTASPLCTAHCTESPVSRHRTRRFLEPTERHSTGRDGCRRQICETSRKLMSTGTDTLTADTVRSPQ